MEGLWRTEQYCRGTGGHTRRVTLSDMYGSATSAIGSLPKFINLLESLTHYQALGLLRSGG